MQLGVLPHFFFKQETAYELRISDWSSDVCSSDLLFDPLPLLGIDEACCLGGDRVGRLLDALLEDFGVDRVFLHPVVDRRGKVEDVRQPLLHRLDIPLLGIAARGARSEEHTSELQSLMRISYAVFCVKKKKHKKEQNSDYVTKQHNTNSTSQQ